MIANTARRGLTSLLCAFVLVVLLAPQPASAAAERYCSAVTNGIQTCVSYDRANRIASGSVTNNSGVTIFKAYLNLAPQNGTWSREVTHALDSGWAMYVNRTDIGPPANPLCAGFKFNPNDAWYAQVKCHDYTP